MNRYYKPALAVTLLAAIVPAAAQEPAAKPEAAPAAAASAAQDPRDQEIAELKRIIADLQRRLAESDALKAVVEQLQKRIEALEARRPPTPPVEPPPPAEPAPREQPRGAATLLPNISVIGNIIARGGDSRAIPGRGRSHFEELEIAFQDAVAPKLRYDVYISAGKEEDWNVELEEGYLTATAIVKGLNARAGRIRTPIDKFNPLHPHQWLFVTQPSAHTTLVGDHGLISDGAVFDYLLPARGLYANLQFGLWQTTSIHHEDEGHGKKKAHALGKKHEEEGHEEFGFRGGDNTAYSARLALAKELGRNGELELGVGRYWGSGELEDFGRRDMALNALDLVYRRYPGAYKRLWLQANLLAHETQDVPGGTRHRLGGFLLGAYKWNRYWEAGIRGDYTKFPFPFDGKEYGASLFLTRFLTEQTSLRLEYRWERDSEFGAGNGIFFQILFGSGPHSHTLQ
jgi:hypothetical protein